MEKKYTKNRRLIQAYSITEMLVTMFVIMLIILALLPAITNKKHPRQLFSRLKGHGVYYCEKGHCTFNPPQGANELLIMAVGGGGGGAGTKCGETSEHVQGGENDVTGTRKYTPGRALYIEASSSGGGSANGYCEKYPGNYDHYQHTLSCHTDPDCDEIKTYYAPKCEEEKYTICKQENVTRCEEYSDGCGWCTHEVYADTLNCKADCGSGCTTEMETVCRTYSYSPPRWKFWTQVLSSDRKGTSCIGDSSKIVQIDPKTVQYGLPESDPKNSHRPLYPDIDGSFEPNCIGTSSCEAYWCHGLSAYCGSDHYTKYEKSYSCKGGNLEVNNTGLSYACGVQWVPAPQEGDPNRHCRAAHFGGEGGNGTKFEQRVCLSPDIATSCEVKIPSHSVPSVCTQTQINEAAQAKGCVLVYSQIPVLNYITGMVNKIGEKLQGEACSLETILKELGDRNICGHKPGQYNCYEYHTGAKAEDCAKWNAVTTVINYTLGSFGKKNTQIGSPSTAIGSLKAGSANDTTISIGGLKEILLKGGEGGAFGKHGLGGDGALGGRHEGSGGEHSTVPKINSQDGNAGYLTFTEKWIDVGQGGEGGSFKMGYFKNIIGPIEITIGEGGAEGKKGTTGVDGGTTIVKAQKGGYSQFQNSADTGHIDNGNTTGILLEAEGGNGGKHLRRYESCNESNEYTGTKGGLSKLSDYGKGGDGSSTKSVVPECSASDGKKGDRGVVIIFY